MSISYPDVIGEHIATQTRYETDGLQYVGYFEPAQIAPKQVANLYLFLQNTLNAPIKSNFKVAVSQSGGFLRGGKDKLQLEAASIALELAAGEVGLLTIPLLATEQAKNGDYKLIVDPKVNVQKGAKRIRPTKSQSKLDKAFIDDMVGLNLVSSLGATYTEKPVKKAAFELNITGNPASSTDTPNLKHSYEQIWQQDEYRFFSAAVKELNSRQVKLQNDLTVEKIYANLFSETTVRFADAGLPLRIGEAIIMAKILTYSCQYFLSDQQRQQGLLVPIWEQALEEGVDTSDSLNVIRTVGYHHIMRLAVAISFGLVAQGVGQQLWPLEDRQGVINHIADSIEVGELLDEEFIYLPLLMAGTHITPKFKLKGENVNHTLALIKKAQIARTGLFSDQDMAQAKKAYNHIFKKAVQ